MARLPRLDFPEVPRHVVHRGVDRGACFRSAGDRHAYLRLLQGAAQQEHVDVHAYVLMTNHVHLLVTPYARGSLSEMMQCLGRRYVRYFNDLHERTGPLFEGRFKASLVDSERYLLRCYRYIELNPVRAGLVEDPAEYPWSSCRSHLAGAIDPLVRDHPAFLRLGRAAGERAAVYGGLLGEALSEPELTEIRLNTNRNRALGTEAFHDALGIAVPKQSRVLKGKRGVVEESGPNSAIGT